VLAGRVHQELLLRQRLPTAMEGKKLWRHRLEDIAGWEQYLARQGLVVLKFFLHVSKQEQKLRLLGRLDHPTKNWKFSAGDVAERRHWDEYMSAYEEAIAATAAPHAPWFVVPADNKWFARLVVVAAMIDALEKLDLHPPTMPPDSKATLEAARVELMKE
jgi:polyphosphate kinase 2 (PPK2 family)